MGNLDKLKEDLEILVDNTSLGYVLTELATICEEKAEHIRATYQDRALAHVWDKAGIKIEKVSDKVTEDHL